MNDSYDGYHVDNGSDYDTMCYDSATQFLLLRVMSVHTMLSGFAFPSPESTDNANSNAKLNGNDRSPHWAFWSA